MSEFLDPNDRSPGILEEVYSKPVILILNAKTVIFYSLYRTYFTHFKQQVILLIINSFIEG
jgi:hypothetical protein